MSTDNNIENQETNEEPKKEPSKKEIDQNFINSLLHRVVEQKNEETIEEFMKGYIENLSVNNYGLRFYCLETNKKEESNVAKESIERLNNINKEIEWLRQSGQLAILAPKIYEIGRAHV